MAQENDESTKKAYRVAKVEGKITWRIEELWDGGVTRQPYGSQHSAIMAEEKIAQENGFLDVLVLEEIAGEEVMPQDAFQKDADGNWRCLKACPIHIENKTIEFVAGTVFEKGIPFMGIDVADWLDKNYASHQRA